MAEAGQQPRTSLSFSSLPCFVSPRQSKRPNHLQLPWILSKNSLGIQRKKNKRPKETAEETRARCIERREGSLYPDFYSTTTQRPDRPKRPSAHTNISAESQAQPLNPNSKKASTKGPKSSSSSSRGGHSPHSTTSTHHRDTKESGSFDHDRMQSTLSPNTKARLGTAHSETGKLNPIASGHTTSFNLSPGSAASDRKHAILSAEQRGAAQKVEVNGRPSSISSSSQATSGPLTTVASRDPVDSEDLARNPFTRRHGRRYLRDSSLQYPLPADLREIHRQVLRTILLCQVFGGPVCSPVLLANPPTKVLEVCCGSGYWSSLCHDFYSKRGFSDIQFVGLDVAPVAPENLKNDIHWKFVQHNIQRTPLPFDDEEFDMVMLKDSSLTIPTSGSIQQQITDEYLRILRPGGVIEIWDGDHTIRMLLPHSTPLTGGDEGSGGEQNLANSTGTYTVTSQTPLAAPQNQFLLDFNSWIVKALDSRQLSPMPCTIIRPWLLQEAETLVDIDTRRLAIPLGEVRWEREGVGGAAVTSKAAALHSKGKFKESESKESEPNESEPKVLSASQAALRRTALMTVVQYVESLEPILRETSGKGQDEWDRWMGGLMKDLMEANGTSWGECLEVGAWWAKKREPAS